MAANSGSLPLVVRQRSRIVSRERLMAFAGWWQVTHARPFAPSGSKKGFPMVSIGPSVENPQPSQWGSLKVISFGSDRAGAGAATRP